MAMNFLQGNLRHAFEWPVAEGNARSCSLPYRRSALLLASAAAFTVGGVSEAAAQSVNGDGRSEPRETISDAPEIVVTARRTDENLQAVPIAITALQSEQLRDQAIKTPIDLQFHAPSLQSRVTNTGSFTGGYTVRGIPGVTSYFAEVVGGPTFPASPYYDVSSVQVLNGPQGTLFGRSSIGGAVLVTPARPELDGVSGVIDATVGSLGTYKMTGVLNLPIIDDELAVRIAVNRNRHDGYVEMLNTGQKFNDENNYSARLSLLWKPADTGFTNYTVFNFFKADQNTEANMLTLVNPAGGLFALPPAYYGLVLTGPCTTAFNAGIASSVANCVSQRSDVLAGFLPHALAEQARLREGGRDALRYTAGSSNGGPRAPYMNEMVHYTFVNHTELELGDLGFTTLTLRNIFGLQASRSQSTYQFDGLGGDLLFATTQNANGVPNTWTTSCAQQHTHLDAPATLTLCDGPMAYAYSDEVQLRGVAGKDLLTWQIGAYFERQPTPAASITGIPSPVMAFSGITTPTWGFTPFINYQTGRGGTRSQALYGQGTLNLSGLTPFIEGLHLTGGYRYTWDKSIQDEAAVVIDPATGEFSRGAHIDPVAVPGVPICGNYTSCLKTSGWNGTLSLDAQLTPNWLVYLATRRAYIPGGINQYSNAQDLPGFVRSYKPETVRDIEIGSKLNFSLGDARVRLNAAAYDVKFKNMFVNYLLGNPPAAFIANAAAARVRGLEFQAGLIYRNLEVGANYTYTDAKYTRYIASDPFGIETTPGSAYCSPEHSTPTACLLDLSKSDFPNTPRHQGNVSVAYTLPLSGNSGDLKFTGTAYFQSRVAFNSESSRAVELFGPTLGAENVRYAAYQKDYQIYNLRIEWQRIFGSNVDAAAFVNNLTNSRYRTFGQINTLQSLGYAAAQFGSPRTWGVQLRYQFGS